MFVSLAQSLDELSAADARRAALGYVSEAFAEALLDGIDVDSFAEARFARRSANWWSPMAKRKSR